MLAQYQTGGPGLYGWLGNSKLLFSPMQSLDHRLSKIVSEHDQEIPQSQTADNPMSPRGRATQPSRDPRKTK